jgi:hypothetical protein
MPFNTERLRANMQNLRTFLTKSNILTLTAICLVLAHEFSLASFIMASLVGPAISNVKIRLAALSMVLSIEAEKLKLHAVRELPIGAAFHATAIIDALREMVNASHVIPMLLVNSIRIVCTLPSFLGALVSPTFLDAHDVSPEFVPAVRFLAQVLGTVFIFHQIARLISRMFKFWYLWVGVVAALLISMMF